MRFFRDILGVLTPISMWLHVRLKGEYVGSDSIGHKYYCAPPRKTYRREQRWVLYPNTPDASAIPPEYHGWLHHQTDIFPTDSRLSYRQNWQQGATPNLTGTPLAYHPNRSQSSGDYEAWKP